MRHVNKQIQSANQMAHCHVCGQMCAFDFGLCSHICRKHHVCNIDRQPTHPQHWHMSVLLAQPVEMTCAHMPSSVQLNMSVYCPRFDIQKNFCYKPLQTLTERKLTWMKIKLSCKILLGSTSLISIVDILNIMYQSLSTHTKYVQQ
jgi:hypothetical protein